MSIKGEYRDVLSKNGEVIVDTGWKSNAIVEDYGRFLAALMKKDFKETVGIDYMAVGSGSSKDSAVFREKVIKFIDECLYLFSIDVSFEKDLNNEEGNISEKLKKEFKTKKDITLSNSAKIRKRKENEWVITDGEKIYIVKKEDGKLNIGLGPLEVGEKGKKGYCWVWAKEIKDSDIKYLDSDEEGKEVEVIDKRYLFSWNDVPEKDSEKRRLINFLVQNPQRRQKDADWIKNAEIEKTDENKTIKVIDKENSIILKRNEEENKVTLQEIRGKKTYEFGFTLKGKEENGKLNIYDTRITNRLKIDVKFEKEEPSEEPLEFREFALLGIDKNSGGTFDTKKMFFINYVDHGVITKDEKMVLTRTVILKFPIEKEEEVSCANRIG